MSKRHDSPLGKLPESWSLVHLKDVAEKVKAGATPRGGDSSYLPSRDRFALIRSQNVFDRRFDEAGLAFISDEQAGELSGAEVQVGDVLLNITGDGITFARSALVPGRVLPACVNQHVMLIRPRRNKCDPGFLLSYLTHPRIKAYIESFNAGGSRRAITKGHIESFVIPLPPLSEQKAIAEVLRSLDDKIALNRRMNETLEAMARTLFQNWFVDATQAGLPKGWAVRALYDCADYINGSAFRNQHFSPETLGLPVIKIGELKEGITEQTKFTKEILDVKYRITSGEILFSWSGSPDTSIDIFVWTGRDGWLNQHIFKIQFKRAVEKYFVYYLLRHFKAEFIEIARNKQTTGLGHVTAQDLKRLKTTFPPDDVLVAFNRIAEPLFQMSYSNSCESRTLATLRDALLPKLLSGEFRITNLKALSNTEVSK